SEGGSVWEIAYAPGDASPVAHAQADPTSSPTAPVTVQFTGSGSTDPDGDQLSYSWDFGDGSAPSTKANPKHTYDNHGLYRAQLTVNDGRGRTSTDQVTITVGNPPTATIEAPAQGDHYQDGQAV